MKNACSSVLLIPPLPNLNTDSNTQLRASQRQPCTGSVLFRTKGSPTCLELCSSEPQPAQEQTMLMLLKLSRPFVPSQGHRALISQKKNRLYITEEQGKRFQQFSGHLFFFSSPNLQENALNKSQPGSAWDSAVILQPSTRSQEKAPFNLLNTVRQKPSFVGRLQQGQ